MSWVPTTRRVSLLAVIPQWIVMAALMLAGTYLLQSSTGVLLGAAAFFAYSLGMRELLAGAHRRGIRLVRSQQFEQAVPAFEESYEHFTRHPWLDQYRAIVMLSASAMSYREMALCNAAFCYSQIGNGQKAKELYRRALAEFPNSGLATTALRMIDSAEAK